MKIPWANLYLDKTELNEVIKAVKSGQLSQGVRVAQFEEKMRQFVQTKYAVAVNSGTAALDVALKILKIQPQDEVIVPAFTYIASASCILYQGATPVFCDIDPITYTIDPEDVAQKITKKTKCIIAVDYAGQGPDYKKLRKIARAYNIPIVEDAAPGLGGAQDGKKLCSLGDISITSFHAAKIMSTIEGGMIFTNKASWRDQMHIIRSQGEDLSHKYHHPLLGHNYRMTELGAAFGLAQAKRLNKLLAKRANIASFYTKQLKKLSGLILPQVAKGNKHAWFLYPILVEKRDKLRAYLAKQGISTNVSWPLPIYDQKPYQQFKKQRCLVAERVAKHVLCLPMYYIMTNKEMEYIIEHIQKGMKKLED
ncbi:MAG: DegT/DnrJ/EryC1/StrS family aminotransferase [Pseudomonadota bacterium]